MARISALAVAALAGVPMVAAAEPGDQTVEADLGSGVIGVGYERQLAAALAARVTVQLERPWYTGLLGGHESDVIGVGVELRPWWFPAGRGPAGAYVSSFARAAAIRATDDRPSETSGLGWSAGATAGWGWQLADDRLLVRLGAGVQYWAFELDGAGVAGVYPDVDIIVGATF